MELRFQVKYVALHRAFGYFKAMKYVFELMVDPV